MAIASTPLLDRLLADGVIRQDHHDAARARFDGLSAEPYSTLGEALFWLVDEGIVSDADLAAIGELSVSQGAFAGNATRREALAEMDALMQRMLGQYEQQLRQVSRNALFPGSRWVWRAGGVIALGAVAWFLFAPATPPQCGDTDVQKSIRMSLFSARSRQAITSPMVQGPASADMLMATFSDIRQVGYIKDERSRGCTATVKIGETSSAMAYTIGANAKGDMVIAGADPRIVRARYGQVDQNGKRLDVGQPLGAARLAQAFEQGVVAFDQQVNNSARKAAFDKQRQRMGLAAETDSRSVRNVQPLGNCKDLGGGKWSCRLQAEYRDRLLSALGRSDWQVFEGNFDFVQEGAAWRVGEYFTTQYMDAIVRGRVAEMKGDEAAAMLEEIQSRRQTPGAPPRKADAPSPSAPREREHRSDGAVINK